MKLRQLYEHGGRIVKGVNTTPDVGVNQIPIEAGKFGFKVDKDGRPPELNKKARKNTNIADQGQKRDLDNKKCTIIPYSKMPHTTMLRQSINLLGIDKFISLISELPNHLCVTVFLRV